MNVPADNLMTVTDVMLTDRAAQRIVQWVAEQGNPNLKLRVSVQGGGCSGFQYAFTFDDQLGEDDVCIQHQEASLVVDTISLPFLHNASIDWQQDLQGAQFVVLNPNATSTCGCGTSFEMG